MSANTAAYDDSNAKAPSMLMASLRRWPLLILGGGVGLLLGFFVFAAQAPVYQSSAKVLVIKQQVQSGTVPGATYVDDYVAAQISVIKSELILTSAAKRPELSQLSEPLPENPTVAAAVLLAGLTVTRDKEAVAGGVSGSNVLIMSFKGKTARDSYLLLQAIVDAYRLQLTDVYAGQNKLLIRELENTIAEIQRSIDADKDKRSGFDRELRRITPEDLAVIRTRVSTGRERQFAISIELTEIEDELKLIRATGNNRRDRLAALTLLGVSKKLGAESVLAAPENRLPALQAERSELGERLGKDHPQIKSLDAQIAFFKRLQAEQNPDDPNGALDELSQLQRQLERRRSTAKAQIDAIGVRFQDDEKHLRDGDEFAASIRDADNKIGQAVKRKDEKDLELKTLSSKTAGGYDATVLTPPHDGMKIGTGLASWLLAGAALGVLLGMGLAVLAELTDKSFRTAAEIRQRLGAPVFGHLPPINVKLLRDADVSASYDPSLVVATRPKSMEAEAYRGVRAQLLVLTQDKGHQIIQVTSPNPGDGKSTLAANLAISIAQAGKTVVLLDCDFRKPRVHKLFNIPKPELGLASVTDGQAELATAIRHSDIDRLDLLPCGTRPSNPAELLSSAKFQHVLSELRSLYDFVIVDTPPMLAVSDPRVVAQRVDGVILVFKITKKSRPQTERAREQLADMGANLLGIVVNGVGTSLDQYGYNYQYSYDYEYAPSYTDDTPSGEIVTAR